MPSDYWATNCFVGASVMHRDDCARRALIGVNHIMWGSDYPHLEGTRPFSKEAIRKTFAGIEQSEVHAMLAGNAAAVYDFNLSALQPLAAQFGPLVSEVASGLDVIPDGVTSPAFQERMIATV